MYSSGESPLNHVGLNASEISETYILHLLLLSIFHESFHKENPSGWTGSVVSCKFAPFRSKWGAPCLASPQCRLMEGINGMECDNILSYYYNSVNIIMLYTTLHIILSTCRILVLFWWLVKEQGITEHNNLITSTSTNLWYIWLTSSITLKMFNRLGNLFGLTKPPKSSSQPSSPPPGAILAATVTQVRSRHDREQRINWRSPYSQHPWASSPWLSTSTFLAS